MEELYWITRLDGINVFLNLLVVISTVFTGCSFIGGLIMKGDNPRGSETYNKGITVHKYSLKFAITALIVSIIFIFTPTKKDALLIYGVGGTIDYIKSNETAKQLPDKAVQALDKLISDYIEEPNNGRN